MARLLKLGLVVLGGILYVWFAAVRNVPRVLARKARRRSNAGG